MLLLLDAWWAAVRRLARQRLGELVHAGVIVGFRLDNGAWIVDTGEDTRAFTTGEVLAFVDGALTAQRRLA